MFHVGNRGHAASSRCAPPRQLVHARTQRPASQSRVWNSNTRRFSSQGKARVDHSCQSKNMLIDIVEIGLPAYFFDNGAKQKKPVIGIVGLCARFKGGSTRAIEFNDVCNT